MTPEQQEALRVYREACAELHEAAELLSSAHEEYESTYTLWTNAYNRARDTGAI